MMCKSSLLQSPVFISTRVRPLGNVLFIRQMTRDPIQPLPSFPLPSEMNALLNIQCKNYPFFSGKEGIVPQSAIVSGDILS